MHAHEFAQIGGAHVVALLAERIFEIELVDAQAVRIHHVAVIRHAARDPMMTAHRLDPPHLMRIGEANAVAFVRAIFLEQRAQALHALASGVNVRQHDCDEILLANAAGHCGHVIRVAGLADRRRVRHERVCAERARVRRDRLGGRHRHVRLVDTGLAPHAVARERIRGLGILQRIVGQLDRQVTVHACVGARLVFRPHDDELLVVERAGLVVFIARDDRRPVITRAAAHQNCSACHFASSISRIGFSSLL